MPSLISWSWSFSLVPPEPHHLSRAGRISLLVGGGLAASLSSRPWEGGVIPWLMQIGV